MEKRKYTQRKRAELQDETRQRIVEATMALHEELGPRNASISAIAARAGVQRLTVYRHFADETALFQACTSCWLERHPPPPLPPKTVDGPQAGTRRALTALYRYYAATQRMWEVSYRDVDLVPALHGPMQQFEAYFVAYGDSVCRFWSPTGAAAQTALRATLALAVRYATWQSLAAQGLDGDAMAALVVRWVQAAAAAPGNM